MLEAAVADTGSFEKAGLFRYILSEAILGIAATAEEAIP